MCAVMCSFPPAVNVSGQQLPCLHSEELVAEFKKCSNSDPAKHQEEGLIRALDSASTIMEDMKMARKVLPGGNEVLICSVVMQSQCRAPYTPQIRPRLTPDQTTIAAVLDTQCNCVRRDHRSMCKHRAALLMTLYITTCKGHAGNPTARRAYWKGNLGIVDGAVRAARYTEIVTDRATKPQFTELQKEEETLYANGKGTGAAYDTDESEEGESNDAGGGAKKRKRQTKTETWQATFQSVQAACKKHFVFDAEAVQKLADIQKKHKIPRLLRTADDAAGSTL